MRETHLLVLGAPRSGTTLLSAMLSCHPDISLLNEELTGASLAIFSKRIRGVKLCAPHQIELEHSAAMQAVARVRGSLRRFTNAARGRLGLPRPNGGFLKSRLSIRDYQRATDHLHVIGIIRSPTQVIDSIQRRGHQKPKVAEHRWIRLVEILHQLVTEERPGTTTTIVHFDSLVREPEETLRRCLGALACDFTPAVLEGYRHTPQYRGRTKIDARKVSGGIAADLQCALLASRPELAAQYRELFERAV